MLEDLTPPERVFSCSVRKLYNSLDDADKAILYKALYNMDAWTHKGLERALRSRGLKISESSIRKHRIEQCSCDVGWHNA
jgi:hypothetical protein